MYCTVDKSLAQRFIPELVSACFDFGGGGLCACVRAWATQRQCCNLASICSPLSYRRCFPPQKGFEPVNEIRSSLTIPVSALFPQPMPVAVSAVSPLWLPRTLRFGLSHFPHPRSRLAVWFRLLCSFTWVPSERGINVCWAKWYFEVITVQELAPKNTYMYI